MLKPRHLLEKELTLLFENLEDTKIKQDYYKELEEEFNIPIDMSSDIISVRRYLSEYNEFILFAVTSVINKRKVSTYFTPREIENYTGQKYKRKKINPRMDLPMFAVADDQWIGASDAQFLMMLRESQAINYNADTQRALEVLTNGGKTIYRPSVDYTAVKEIAEAFAEEQFVPNTISLNINLDDEQTELIFKDNILHIRNFTAFDIFDGYHRYLAMATNYDRDHNWNYPIELRITNFSVSKARQFIYQEDHKTKMKRVDVAAFDQYNPGNIITERLNKDPEFNLYNMINLKDGLIHSGLFSIGINRCYFNKRNKVDRRDIIAKSKIIKSRLNDFTDEYNEYLDRKWKKYEIWTIIYGIYKNHSLVDIHTAIEKVDKKILDTADDLKNKQLTMIKEVYGDE